MYAHPPTWPFDRRNDMIRQSHVQEHVIGACPFTWPWYEDVAETSEGLTWWDPIDEVQVYVTWARIIATLQDLAYAPSTIWNPAQVNAGLLAYGRFDQVDFDADSADVVIQRAAFGEVRYG